MATGLQTRLPLILANAVYLKFMVFMSRVMLKTPGRSAKFVMNVHGLSWNLREAEDVFWSTNKTIVIALVLVIMLEMNTKF